MEGRGDEEVGCEEGRKMEWAGREIRSNSRQQERKAKDDHGKRY
jgi:hypothetical protein